MDNRNWQKVDRASGDARFCRPGTSPGRAEQGTPRFQEKEGRAGRQETQTVPLAAGHPGRRRRGGPGRAADQGEKTDPDRQPQRRHHRHAGGHRQVQERIGGQLRLHAQGRLPQHAGQARRDGGPGQRHRDHGQRPHPGRLRQRRVHPDGQSRRRDDRHAGGHGKLSPG